MEPSPSTDPRHQTAVRLTRLLLSAYGLAIVGLFGPAMFRVAGVEIVPRPAQAYVSGGLLLAMTVLLIVWFLRMVQLGEYSRHDGLRFALIPALLDGRYEAESFAPSARPLPAASPLGALAVDVASCVEVLNRAGRAHLAQSLQSTLHEGEGLATRLLRWPPGEDDPRGALARSAIGRFEEHVQQLRVASVPADDAAEAAFVARIEGDLDALRAAADALRTPPGSPQA